MSLELNKNPKWHKREKLRTVGQFWTPRWVADAMISFVSIGADSVLDPAVGKGVFLDSLRNVSKKKIPFYGYDIDENVINEKIFNDTNCVVKKADFLKTNITEKFSAIVANPPYIRHHRLDTETKLFLKQLTKQITGFTLDGRTGYHNFFLLKALSLLEKNGRLAFILPADTCEGVSANKLWFWITKHICIEAVIIFDKKATPFPEVDTNPIIFLLKNSKPKELFKWIKVLEPEKSDLQNLVASNFSEGQYSSLEVFNRITEEALQTGFTRSIQSNKGFKYHLSDFAKVMRGIATGANEYFLFTKEDVDRWKIPEKYFKKAVGRTRDVSNDILSFEEIKLLDEKKRPTYLLSIENKNGDIPVELEKYIKIGEEMGLPERPLIKQRNPWFKMEKRETPPLLFAYLGRRNSRFILNKADAVPLTGFLCVYPKENDEEQILRLWQVLNHPDTIKNLSLVGKSYGSGAIKVEPRNLERLGISEELVKKYNLISHYQNTQPQLNLFVSEQKQVYKKK